MSTKIHTKEIVNHIMSLFESDLKTSLSLVGIYKGGLAWLPPIAISEMANGIWLDLTQTTDIEEVAMPTGIQVIYRIRIIYVRRIDISNNVLDAKMNDAATIIDKIYEKHKLPGLTLNGGNVLWWLPSVIEYQPAEDNFVSAIAADLTAVAFNTEVIVRTKF